MKDRFPRTAVEFAEHGRVVVVQCDDCQRSRSVDPETLLLTFGADFDCYDGLAELKAQLRCEECGEARRFVYFRNTREKHFEPVSMEQATINTLELNAFARANGQDSQAGHHAGRYRKFGRAR
jgi:DNA-directed RNA polymerase subunit RPC12/RpoP